MRVDGYWRAIAKKKEKGNIDRHLNIITHSNFSTNMGKMNSYKDNDTNSYP